MSTETYYPEGLLGKKMGMTQLFTDNGKCIPVTAIQVGPCFVLDVKDQDKHGYSAVQLGFEEKKPQRVNKPEMGHFKKSGAGAFYHVRELRCDVDSLGWNTLGQELKVGEVFAEGQFVDISGTSIGRGFSGVVRKFRVQGQPATRGTHENRRHIGSIGNCKTPARVRKNKKMPGQYGNSRVTIQNLKVVKVYPDKGVILVKGAVPGSKGGVVEVRKATKKQKANKAA